MSKADLKEVALHSLLGVIFSASFIAVVTAAVAVATA